MANTEITTSFPIFHPVGKFYWTPDIINFALIGITCLTMALPLNAQLSLVLRLFFCCLFSIHFVYRLFTRYSTHETLKGYIQGAVQLKPLEIIFDGTAIPISTITKLDFNFIDYEGQRTGSALYLSLNGQLSNGINNSITIYFTNSRERKIFFQRKEPDDIILFKPLLIEYCKKGLLSFNTLISLLHLSYKEVQELKAEYF